MDPQAFAARLAADLGTILNGLLVGVYLHGSLVLGCFNPARSDVDVLVVTRHPMGPEMRSRLVELLLDCSGEPYPIELTVLTQSDLTPWRYPTSYDFHFGESLRAKLVAELASGELTVPDGGDTDLAGHVGLLRDRGQVLLGLPVADVFPTIPETDFRDSILRDLEWIQRSETRMGGSIYGALNACRVLAYLRTREILSKAEAGEWALRNLPPELLPTAACALAAYRFGAREPCPPEEVRSFVAAVVALVEEELSASAGAGIPSGAGA